MSNFSAEQLNYLARVRKRLVLKQKAYRQKMFSLGTLEGLERYKIINAAQEASMLNSREFKIDCALELARTIVEEQLSNKPELIIFMAQKILKNIAEHTDVEISAHPSDAIILNGKISELSLLSQSPRKIIVSNDESLKRGSLVVKANKSIVDAQLSTLLSRAREILIA